MTRLSPPRTTRTPPAGGARRGAAGRTTTKTPRMPRTTVRPALLVAATLALLAGCDRMDRQRELDSDSPYARQVREAIPRIEQATGLTFKRPPSVAVRSSRDVREFVLRQFEDSATAAQMRGLEVVYKRLGAIPERTNLRDLYVDLLEEQVVGYYDPKRDTLYVVEGRDATATGIVIPHELIHALQDQYVDLDSILSQRDDADRAAAAQAVLEGQATFDQLTAMTGGIISATTNWDAAREQIRSARSATPKMAAAPTIVQEGLVFPYLSGAEYVRRLRNRDTTLNVLARFPLSTEQVMHADAFLEGKIDAPLTVRFAGLTGITWQNTVGEFETRVVLYEQLRDVAFATRAALGWGGDRVALLGDDVLAWASAWDGQVDAGEFFEAVSRAMGVRYEAPAEGAEGATTRLVRAKGRLVTVTVGEVGGRPTVLVVDAPAGRAVPVTLANVQVGDVGAR
jgi:hypothetical protein